LWKHFSSGDKKILDRPLSKLVSRLDALLLVLKSCKGAECITPWATLHPDGKVKNLVGALDEKFDDFYNGQPKVSYDRCEYGYVVDAEGPQHALAYRHGYPLEAWV
jgi:hypothetical protein